MGSLNRGFLIAVSIISVIILVLMAFSAARDENFAFISRGAAYILNPTQKLFSLIGEKGGNAVNFFKNLGSYKKRYEELLGYTEELERQNRDLADLEQENRRFRQLLSFKERNSDIETIGARVIATDPTNYSSILIVDRGSRDGITKNRPVITDKGLVGHVISVASMTSKVLTINDPHYSVAVNIMRCDTPAVAEGDLSLTSKNFIRLAYIDKDSTATVGDYVETSGMGGIYPRGLLLGRITAVQTDPQGLYNTATVEAAEDINTVSECLIMLESSDEYEEDNQYE